MFNTLAHLPTTIHARKKDIIGHLQQLTSDIMNMWKTTSHSSRNDKLRATLQRTLLLALPSAGKLAAQPPGKRVARNEFLRRATPTTALYPVDQREWTLVLSARRTAHCEAFVGLNGCGSTNGAFPASRMRRRDPGHHSPSRGGGQGRPWRSASARRRRSWPRCARWCRARGRCGGLIQPVCST